MLKFEGIPVGSKIRAYDFEPYKGRDDRYVEGTITGLSDRPYKGYVVAVEKDTLYTINARKEIIVPFETGYFEYDERVTVIS